MQNIEKQVHSWLLEYSGIYVFCKDKYSRFIYCNEKFAEVANLDSPQQIVGKSDKQLIWRQTASEYQKDDNVVLNGISNKPPLSNIHSKIVGIIGMYIDLATAENNLCNSVNEYNNIYLTKREKDVLHYVSLGYSNKQIGDALQISPRTVESFIRSLKQKYDCSHKYQLIEKTKNLNLVSAS